MKSSGKDDLYPIANQAVGVSHGVENHEEQTLPSLRNQPTLPDTYPNNDRIDEAASEHTKMYGPTLGCSPRASACREECSGGLTPTKTLGIRNRANDWATSIAKSCLFTYHWLINKVQQSCTRKVSEPGTRPCANLWCDNTAVDQLCTKHPRRLKQYCSYDCYQKSKMNWPVIPKHKPIAEVKMKIVDANASVIPKPGETAILCMFMTQKTAKPVPIVRLCAIGQVKPGLRWLCTLPSARRPQRSTDNKYKTIYEPAEMNLSDTEFEPDDEADANDHVDKSTRSVSKRVPDNFHTDLRELVGDIPKRIPANKTPVPADPTEVPYTRSKATGVNKAPLGKEKAAGGVETPDNDCTKEDHSFKQFIIRVAVGKPKQASLRCKAMIDTGASCSFISKDMIAKLGKVDMIYMPLTVLLGDGSQSNTTHRAVLEIVLQNEALPVEVAIMDALPCSIGMILGNDWISKHKLTLTPHRLEIRFTNARHKEIIVHGLSTIVHQSSMPTNKGMENDYDQLLNTMVNLGGDIDIPPTEVKFLHADALRKKITQTQNKADKKWRVTRGNSTRPIDREFSDADYNSETMFVLSLGDLTNLTADDEGDENPPLADGRNGPVGKPTGIMASTIPIPMDKSNINDQVRDRGKWPSCRPAVPQLTVPMLATYDTASVLDETGTVPALGETSVQDGMDIDNSTSLGHLPSDRTILPSSSSAVRNDDVLDEDYSEISEELAALTAHASEFAKPVKGKCTRPSSRRGQTQTTVHTQNTVVKTRKHSNDWTSGRRSHRRHKPNSAEKFKTTGSGTGFATLCATSKKRLEEYKNRKLEPMEQESANEHMKIFEDTKTKKLPEELINATDPQYIPWVEKVLKDKQRFACITPMTKFRTLDTEPLKIEDRDDVVGPPPRRTYRVPQALQGQLKLFCDEMVSQGWIQPSKSEWCSPVLILKKSNGGWRFLVDLRGVNARTKPISYYMPDMHECWQRLRNAKILSTCDLDRGYWQLNLDKQSRMKTAFATPYGNFEYKVVPMGLISSAHYFQQALEGIMRNHGILYERLAVDAQEFDSRDDAGEKVRGFVSIFLDDIIIWSTDPDTHKGNLLRLFEVLSKEKLSLNMKKCFFFARYVKYLGIVVGQGQMFMNTESVRSIISMPEPSDSQANIRIFLGMTGFYRKWIDNYATMALPLTKLLKKNTKLPEAWDETASQSVRELKMAITKYPVLRQFDPMRRIYICTDASGIAVGGVLFQYYGDRPCAIAYCSRRLNDAEKNYSVQEQECLGVKFTVDKFRHFLLATPFVIKCLSDHHSLQFLKKGKETGGRIARWALALSEYEYEIHYIPGTKNVVGDALSRLIAAEGHKQSTLAFNESENLACMHVETQQTLATIQDIEQITHGTTNDHTTLHYSDANITFDEFLLEQHPTQTESLLFYRATPAEVNIPVDAASYMECPDFATLYKIIGDELRQKHALNPKSKSAKEFKTWDVPIKLHSKIEQMLKVQEDSKKRKLKLPKNSRRVCNTISNAQARAKNDTYHINKGLLYKVSSMGEDLLCVPDDSISTGRMTLRKKIIAETHDGITSIHLGENRTYYEIRRRVYWPNIAKHVHEYIRTCQACQKNKIDRQSPQGLLNSLQQPTRSGTHYSMDFVTHLPMSSRHEYTAIMVIVDRFSKRIWTIPTWDIANAELTAELFMKHIIYENGICIEIVSDRDSKFTSKMWQDFHAALGITLSISSSRHQSTDGQTERAIAHVEELMRMNINYKQSNWVSLLPKIQFTINTTMAKATGVSPYYAERGRNPLTKLDMDNILRSRKYEVPPSIDEFVAGIANIEREVQERLVLTREWQQRGDKKRRLVGGLTPGKYAYLSTEGITLPWDKHRKIKKLRQEFYGPFKILRQLGPVSFELMLPPQSHIHPVFHAHLLKASDGPGTAIDRASSLPNAADADEYTVESLVDVRGIQGKERYLVKWLGYPYEECTWEPTTNLTNCQKILKKFHRKRKDDAHDAEMFI